MNAFETGLIKSLRLVYASHGGPSAVLRSAYFWSSVIIAVLCWRSVAPESWKQPSMAVLPTLAGFSIAAYAILFAVLDEPSRKALSAPEPDLGNRSPLLMIVGTVTHALIVQVAAILYTFCFDQKPFSAYIECIDSNKINAIFSAIGLFFFIYSIFLVLASVLTLFRVLEIRTKI